ncbi:MAG: serine/threonine protein kinase [Anaerolineae bacterium]|nr:serine/threonine protein kinase [Anaerolineae bacterium]
MFNDGAMIGGYRLISLLGAGGMATVYKAQHMRLDRYVAVKMMHASFLSDPQFVARFEREAQIVAKLEHPHIVPVHDFAEHDGQPFLVMKFIAGISLREALSDGALELRDIMTILPAVASALDYAHSRGVLHRDIKPSNIMLDSDGTPYLTDFGLARTVQAGESSFSQGMLIGTPAYMSPEQGAGTPELDWRSDLYSLGVVLYELVVGKVPFGGSSTYTVLHGHQTEIPPLPSAVNPEIPPAVEAVLLRALMKDPEDRYPAAAAMVKDLREAFLSSNVRRLSAGQRHSIVLSLEKSKAEPKEKPLTRSLPPRPAVSSASPASPASVPPAAAPRTRPRDPLIYVLAAVLLIAVGVLAAAAINARSTPGVAAVPTGAAELLPTMTALPTRAPLPSAQPTLRPTLTLPAGPADFPPAESISPLLASRFAPEIERYEVPLLTAEEANAAIANAPNDPVGYLALLRTQVTAQGVRPRLESILDTIDEGARVADDADRYAATVIDILSSSPTPPEILFNYYSSALEAISDPTLAAAVRSLIGESLYALLSDDARMPTMVLDNLSGTLTANAPPLMPVMLARLAITHNRLPAAQILLNRTGTDFAEARLVQGDLYAAQGDPEAARAAWEAARSMQGAPEWLKAVAAAKLGA